MSHYIPIKQACEYLGITDGAIVTSKKYKRFYRKSDAGKYNASFDLKNFVKYQDMQEEFTEKTKLFTEYLFHIEEMSYTKIASLGKTHIQNVSGLTYGYETAKRIFKACNEFYPFHTKRFHLYYGFSMKGIKYVNN